MKNLPTKSTTELAELVLEYCNYVNQQLPYITAAFIKNIVRAFEARLKGKKACGLVIQSAADICAAPS
jgi:hypothetical protein